MQPPTDGPRSGFTPEQVRYLLESAATLDTDMGMEVLDQDLNPIEDVSFSLRAASITRNSYANIHSSLSFTVDQTLDWGNSIIRPYMTFTGQTAPADPVATMKFYLGAYVTDTPQEDMSQDTSTWDATGYDILCLLDDAIGDAYSVDAGELYLTRVEEIFQARGFTQYVIDQDQSAAVLPSARTYTLDDNVTWLTVVNDLLAAIGYAGVWSDYNGVLRAQRYRTPTDRGPEWILTDDPAVTMLTQRRQRARDFYDAPNHWIFYRNTTTEEEQPSETNGLRFEYTNESNGDTSVEARGGRTITRTLGVDAADAASLAAQAQRTIDADSLIPTVVTIETAPFPLAWHFDRFEVHDAGLGATLQVLATNWTLNLDGSDMSWSWTEI